MPIPYFSGRLAIQQRVLPVYRAPFMDLLATACQGGLSVFAGMPQPAENIAPVEHLQTARLILARNRHFLTIESPFYQCWQSGLLDWLESWQPDVLIMEANPRYLTSTRAVQWMHARNLLVLGWGLGAPPVGGAFSSWRKQARDRFLHQFDGLIAYSQRGASEYAGTGFPAGKVFVAHNAVSARPKAQPPQRPEKFQKRPVVLFVGRLQARKRIDHLLRACASLPSEQQPLLRIVGDGPARGELETLAQQIYPLAHFTGAKHGIELEADFHEADLFVLPGTGGLAVQQAMSYALPVIVAQGDGTQEDLVRPANGWSIPPDDLPSLQRALLTALQDPSRLRHMGMESYRIVSEEVNLECMVEAFIHAVNQVQAAR